MKRLLLIAMLCACVAAPASGNLILNGSFEQANITIPDDPGFVLLWNGDTAITHWKVIGNVYLASIDYVGGLWQSADGGRSLDLSGTQPGGVEQTFDTQIGTTYAVDFWMAGNPLGPPDVKTMNVYAIGSGLLGTGSFSFDAEATGTESMGWSARQWTFVADSLHTTLRFLSATTTEYGPALDNVSVVAVPLPASILLGIFAVGWAGRRLRKFV